MGADAHNATGERHFLFLQGPISPFFPILGSRLRARGHGVSRINLCLGDKLAWRGQPGAVDFRGRPEEWPAYIAAHLDRHRVTDLLLLGEQRYYHQEAIRAAKQRGIQVIATDFGYLRPDWITFEQDGLGRDSRFPRDPAAILALAAELPPPDLSLRHRDSFLNQAAWDVAYHLSCLVPGFFRHYRSHQIYHPVQVYAGTLLRLAVRRRANRRADAILRSLAGRPLFLMAMQMETDFSVRAYSHYPDIDTAIREVVTSFAAHAPPEAQLLFKVHPLDPAMKNWGRRIARIAAAAGISERVHYLGGGNLGAITESVQGVVTINSTVGLRALVDHLPTHALGEAIYNIPGLTHQGPLDRFWTEGQAPEPRLREAFLRGVAACLQIRGVYYAWPGVDAAADAAADRLLRGLVNRPVVEEPPPYLF